MGRSKKKKQGRKKAKKAVIVEEEPEEEVPEEKPSEVVVETDDEWEEPAEEKMEEAEPKKDEMVWEAVDWNNVKDTESESAVFDNSAIHDILKGVVDKAWEDGVITNDEMAMLTVLKNKLEIDDDTFNFIMEEAKPETPVEEESPPPVIEEKEEPEEEYEEEEEEETYEQPPPLEIPKPPSPPEPPRQSAPPPEAPKPPPKRSNIITLTSTVRGGKAPLGESFDLTKKDPPQGSFKRRCPHCRALIRVRPGEGKDSCPICGGKVVTEKHETPGLRRVLDQAKIAFKEGDRKTASELYTIALAQSPENKEAIFYLQKLQHKDGARTSKPMRGDARNITHITTSIGRFDQLLKGGIPVGSQVLLKGPAFCGKEVVLDKVMATTLAHGIPVIYVSSNRAMKEVMQGIIAQVPQFKEHNKNGLVRMYDLFSKHRDGMVLKEGHRIFNIEVREDFKKFQEDLVYLMEELVQQYHGGVMIINSLSPLITQTDQNDLMKFLQVLIARSKSYRFTNILDMAAGVHTESIQNSVEYLMDGIIEFKEQDARNSMRIKGFRDSVLSRDWIDYRHGDGEFSLVGSFQEERIL